MVPFDDALGSWKSQPGAAMLRREERFEDPFTDLGWYPGSVVSNCDSAHAVVGADVDPNVSGVVCGLRGVQEKIEEHDLELLGVGIDDDRGARNIDVRAGVRRIFFQERGGVTQRLFEHHRCELGIARPCEDEQVLHDVIERVESVHDVAQHRSVAVSLRHPAADHLQAAPNSRQGVLDLVRDDGSHLAEAGERRLFAQQHLGTLAFGDVRSNRHGDIQAVVVIQDGRIASATIAQCLTRYSCSVIAKLPPQVAERQSPETDYVSGATQSTNAFYYAVVEALSKAK